jgi:AcrR family transcriptional regulator
MTTSINTNDPRVKRTRQLLLQAFIALLEERQNIHSISVQEIAERATVNRATFYAHFEDKYALLEVWVLEKFRRVLTNQLPDSSTLQISTLRQLIGAVFDFLDSPYRFRPADRQFKPLFEITLQHEIYDLLLKWLKGDSSKGTVQDETVETTAQIISWAIFGPAAQWSQGDRSVPAKEMAHHVLRVVIAGLSPIVALT